jgi:hypothetical protein
MLTFHMACCLAWVGLARAGFSDVISLVALAKKKRSACHGATQASSWHALGFLGWQELAVVGHLP